MGNWKAILPIVISLVIAALGSFLVYRWIQQQTAPQGVVEVEKEAAPVVVAALDLAPGTKLTPEMMRTASFIEDTAPKGHFKSKDQLKDRVTISPLKEGDPVQEHRLAPVDIKTGGVSAVLKPGTRAIAVKGDKVIGISGFINPGNRVDLLVTMEDPKDKTDKTKIILENILVLATGTQIQKNEKGEPAPVDVYTLEVTPEQSEKLAFVAAQGKLQFALRNLIDDENVQTRGFNASQTFGQPARYEPPAAVPAPKASVQTAGKTIKPKWQPRRTVTVEVIRGTEKTKETCDL